MKTIGYALLAVTFAISVAHSDEKRQTLDLTKRGLPIKVDAPGCVKISEPMVKIADNASDLILQCAGNGIEQAFSIQIGLAAGKQSKKDIAQDPSFRSWVTDRSGLVQWEVDQFGKVAQEFILRRQLGKVEYACFSQFPTQDPVLLKSELASCKSIRQ